jgi:RNase P protein component
VPNIETLKKKKDFKNSATMGKMIRMNTLSVRFFDSKIGFSRFGFVIKKKLEKLSLGIK